MIVGGPEVSYDVQDWMKKVNEFDFIIVGEGEESFKRLLRELNSDDKHFDQVPGISYRHEGTILIKPQLHKLNLHDLPSPYRKDVPSQSENGIETSRGVHSLSILFTSLRGCCFDRKN
jgi:radical SAM superfamily enzyme YgiQ (UPF0313 family)